MTPLEVVVLIVADDRARVEADLAAGRLCCPRCGVGVLGGWGCGRLREVRTREGVRRFVAAAGSLSRERVWGDACVLPEVCLAGRRFVVEVIGAAIVAKVAGEGHRPIAERLGVAKDTVRGWLRRFASRGEAIRAHFTRWVVSLDAELGPVLPAGSVLGMCLRRSRRPPGRGCCGSGQGRCGRSPAVCPVRFVEQHERPLPARAVS